jgi:hypothetical protein
MRRQGVGQREMKVPTTEGKTKEWGQNEPAPTGAPGRMDGKWSGNSFLLGASSLANHGG